MTASQLPPNWKLMALGDFADVKYGKARPKDSGNIPVIGSGGEYGRTSKPLIDYPTIVIGRKGTAGLAWLQKHPCYPSDTTFYLQWKDNQIEYQYLYYHLQNTPLSGEHARTTLPSLLKPDLERYSLIVPPLHEQRAISRVLQTVQQACEARLRELELERERKAALMEHLFTHGTRGEPTKQTAIGEMPESWALVELCNIADIIYGVQAAVAHLTDDSLGIPILTNINILNDGRLDLSTLRYYELPESKRNKLILQKGDLLFNWRSGSDKHVGKTAIFNLEEEYTFSSFILRFRVNDLVINNYLLYYLHYLKSRHFFENNRQQSSINSVFNASVAAKLPVFLPLLVEQKDIAKILIAFDSKITALEREISQLDELFRAMLEELMTGRLSTANLIQPEATA